MKKNTANKKPKSPASPVGDAKTGEIVKVGVGRGTAMTPETIETLRKAVLDGLSVRDACVLAGIHESTYYDHRKRGGEFSKVIAQAQAEFKQSRLQRIRAAGFRVMVDSNGNPVVDRRGQPVTTGDFRADAWLLERLYPSEFGPQLMIRMSPEQSAILKRLNLTPVQAMELLFQELAALDTEEVDQPTGEPPSAE